MSNIRFKPFIGSTYKKQDFKLLTLGESHYFGSGDMANFKADESSMSTVTQDVVKRYLDYKIGKGNFENWMSNYTKYGNVVAGKQMSSKETIDFWNSTSFYNYVQAPTANPRVSPTKQEFTDSIEPFKKVLKNLNPDLVILWGHRLWNHFPKDHYVSKLEQEGNKIHYLEFNKRTPILVVPHPSSSQFNYSLTSEINNYIELIKK
ncbi:MAG: uracil-DNA glycosylase [Nonlabens sp.]